MRIIKVYDLPTRFFHWFFAVLFLGAFLLAKNLEPESFFFSVHAMMGLTLVVVLLLRFFWGFLGSRYARWSSLPLHPKALIRYLKDLMTPGAAKYLGHNPASSWGAIAMMALGVGLGITGYLISRDIYKNTLEDIHQLMANAFLVTVLAHIAGLVVHTLKHRDNIGLSMIDGKKAPLESQPGIEKSHTGAAVIFVIIVASFAIYLNNNFDRDTRSLNFFGSQLQLGDAP